MHIGYIGAGLMSVPMIENLLADGHSVTVWNRTPAKADGLADQGARVVATPAGTCPSGGIVMSCLADDAALDAVFADGSVLRALGPGGVHVSMSTISGGCAGRLAESHRAAGASYVAAPICGRPEAVKARTQSFLIAGDARAKARVMDIVNALGRRVFDFGEMPPNANVAKINFNFLIASAIEAMSEAFAVVEKSGLAAKDFYDMLLGTAFGCPIYENYGRQLHQRTWDKTSFKLSLGLKDVKLAATTAKACSARMQLGELLEERYSQALAHGYGDKDWTAIAIDVRAEAGLEA